MHLACAPDDEELALQAVMQRAAAQTATPLLTAAAAEIAGAMRTILLCRE